jgi:zinc/manganese transport system permease protein
MAFGGRWEGTMSEVCEFFVMQTALLAVVLILHTYIGLHVIRRTLIFSDLVLDQLAAFGALAGLAFGIEYGSAGSYFVALFFVVFGAFLLAAVKPRTKRIPREAVIGTMYAMALVASLLLGDKLSGGEAYVSKTLSGAMLWVSWPLVWTTVAVYAVLLLLHYRLRDKFIALTVEGRGSGSDTWWDFLLFTTQGIITILIVPIAGVLLAYAFLMIPAAIAAMFREDWGPAVLLGWGIGMVACLLGLVSSYFFDLPYGPTLVLSLGAFFLAAVAFRACLPGARCGGGSR